MPIFKFRKQQLPQFHRPPRTAVTGELAQRLTDFEPTTRYANFAEVDSGQQLIRFYQTETAFKRSDPIVLRLDEYCGYQLWEDGIQRSRCDLGYAYSGDLLPDGRIMGGKNALPGQRAPRKYIYKRYLTLFFSYKTYADISICLDLISLRTQTESIGYRISMNHLNEFLDFLDTLQNKSEHYS